MSEWASSRELGVIEALYEVGGQGITYLWFRLFFGSTGGAYACRERVIWVIRESVGALVGE